MKSALTSAAAAFALTVALMQLHVLPNAWDVKPPESGFEARHAHENQAEVSAQLGLPGA
jgi:hypothetical protein